MDNNGLYVSKSSMKVIVWIVSLVFWFAFTKNAAATSVDFSGFATLTAGYNSSDEIGFSPNFRNEHHTGWSLSRDSSLGGQVNIGFSSQWDAVGQVVLQDRQVSEAQNYLELAFLRYRPSRNWSIRAGRMNGDLYLLSEYPYVSNAYLWVRPPHEFYSYASSVVNFDGVDLEFSERIYDGFLRVKLAVGESSPPFERYDIENEITFGNLLTLSASYQKGPLIVRGSHTRADVANYQGGVLDDLVNGLDSISPFIWPNASNLSSDLDFNNKKSEFSAFGLAYDSDNWIIQSEVGLTSSDWLIVSSTLGSYISVGYKYDDVTLFSSIARSKVTGDDFEMGDVFLSDNLPPEVGGAVSQLQGAVTFIVNDSLNNQKSIGFGAKWYATPSLTVKAQFDHFTIYPFGGVSWNYQNLTEAGNKQHVNIFSVSASVVF